MYHIGAVEGLIELSMCRQAQGNVLGARQALAQAQRVAMTADAGGYDWIVDFYAALLPARNAVFTHPENG